MPKWKRPTTDWTQPTQCQSTREGLTAPGTEWLASANLDNTKYGININNNTGYADDVKMCLKYLNLLIVTVYLAKCCSAVLLLEVGWHHWMELKLIISPRSADKTVRVVQLRAPTSCLFRVRWGEEVRQRLNEHTDIQRYTVMSSIQTMIKNTQCFTWLSRFLVCPRGRISTIPGHWMKGVIVYKQKSRLLLKYPCLLLEKVATLYTDIHNDNHRLEKLIELFTLKYMQCLD